MPRTVDPARHRDKQLRIIDAALTCFAATGFDRASTAAICRTAGIGSGTFFHYFPTKLSVLLAVLELGTAETTAWFAAQEGRTDAKQVIMDYTAHVADECTDPRIAGFVRAVGAVMTDPEIAAALTRDEAAVHNGLLPWVSAAQTAGTIRTDVPATRLCTWSLVILDGFLSHIAGEGTFHADTERHMLTNTVQRLLAP